MNKRSKVAQSWPTLCDPVDCGLSGSSLYGIFQARVLEWIATIFKSDNLMLFNMEEITNINFVHWFQISIFLHFHITPVLLLK